MKLLRVLALTLVLAGCGTSQTSPRPSVSPSITGTALQVPVTPSLSLLTQTPSVARPSPVASTGCGESGAFAPVASDFDSPVFVTNAGDGSGSLYVVEQVGRIIRLDGGCKRATWLDITDRISSGGERGLLGLAFHRDFASNGRVFVDYTDSEGNTVISEFSAAPGATADPGSERVLLHVDQPFPNHNGGMLAFGPDGYLYIGLGDGGSGGDPMGNGQSLTTLLGKILRIDVDSGEPYGIPDDNPFPAGNAQGALPEIWDYGLRNPWRFSFDRQTGALFIGDVGQGQAEEIDVEPAGEGGRNYGWNVMEGSSCYGQSSCDQTGLTLPVTSYSHDDGCSVTGGYVYRGSQFPALDGTYFFSDYCSGTVWTFDADALNGGPAAPQVFGQLEFSVSSFGEDEAGELYIVDLAGTIYSLGGPR